MRVLVAVAATVALVIVLVALAVSLVLGQAPEVASVEMDLADHIVHAESLGASVDLRVESVLQDEDVIAEARNDYSHLSRRSYNVKNGTARWPTDIAHLERTGRFSAGV